MARSSCCSATPGSMPSSTFRCSASPGTPRVPRPASRSGTTRASAARAGVRAAAAPKSLPRARPPAAACRPSASSASTRSSMAARRNSSRRSTSTRANGSNSRSARGRPATATPPSRSSNAARAGSPPQSAARPQRPAAQARDRAHPARPAARYPGGRAPASAPRRRRGEGLAQPPDLHSQHVVRPRALIALQLPDQPITRDHAVGTHEQQREQRPLLGRRHAPSAVEADIQRAQDQELQATASGTFPVSPMRLRAPGRDPVVTFVRRQGTLPGDALHRQVLLARRHRTRTRGGLRTRCSKRRRGQDRATYLGLGAVPGRRPVLCLFEADARGRHRRATGGHPLRTGHGHVWISPSGGLKMETALRDARRM